LFGLWLIVRLLREQRKDREPFFPWAEMKQTVALRLTLMTQGNIMIRTLAMLAGFAWFTRQGALLGEATLAANHVLLNLISFCAFFLDGFALPAESLVGVAKGRRDRAQFDRAVNRTTLLAAGTALVLAIVLWGWGDLMIAALTDLETVRSLAAIYLPWVAVYIGLSFAAFQLDGIFIGTTHATEMRNASLVSVLLFMVMSAWLAPLYGNTALWLCFVGYVVIRAISLLVYYPCVRKRIALNE